jgi:predicted permease
MESVKSAGAGLMRGLRTVVVSISTNALMIGIALGFVANLTGFVPPAPLAEAIDLMVRAALPAALFGLGGVLVRYRPEGDLVQIGFVCAIGLLVHPAIVWTMSTFVTDLDLGQKRSAVLTAAMAPGVNGYIFASMYGVAKRVAASAVLIGTATSILTVSVWLAILG